jgi:hypothetical protein
MRRFNKQPSYDFSHLRRYDELTIYAGHAPANNYPRELPSGTAVSLRKLLLRAGKENV